MIPVYLPFVPLATYFVTFTPSPCRHFNNNLVLELLMWTLVAGKPKDIPQIRNLKVEIRNRSANCSPFVHNIETNCSEKCTYYPDRNVPSRSLDD
jgi:hypothetical protein